MSFLFSQARAVYEQFGSFTALLANGQWRLAKKKKKLVYCHIKENKFLFWLLATSAISIQNITTKTKLTLYWKINQFIILKSITIIFKFMHNLRSTK